MKNLIFIAILIIATFQMNAQTVNKSLAQITGEQQSLYNAVCIYNNITPGDIGMKEGRKLMSDYAKTIGLNYELYRSNGGNNLYILHYVNESSVTTKIDEFCSTCVGHDAVDRTVNIVDTIVKIVKDTVTVTKTKVIVKDKEIIVTKVDTVNQGYCDCENLTIDQALAKRELLKKEFKTDQNNSNGAINIACRIKLRRYIKSVKHTDRVIGKKNNATEDKVVVTNNFWVKPIIDDVKPVKSSFKKKGIKRLGKGLAKSKCNSFLIKLFPFIGCR